MLAEDYISNYKICNQAQDFLRTVNTFEKAWKMCRRGDWMLDAAQILGVNLDILTSAKVECVNTVRHLIQDDKTLKALDIGRRFANGEVSPSYLQDAVDKIYHTEFHIKDYDLISLAGEQARVAACDALSVTAAAWTVAYNVARAAAQANHENYALTMHKNQFETAEICREILTNAINKKLISKETKHDHNS